jgi:hypothetical protein
MRGARRKNTSAAIAARLARGDCRRIFDAAARRPLLRCDDDCRYYLAAVF